MAAKSSYYMDVEGVVAFQNGMVRGLEEGDTYVTVIYSDPLGNELRSALNVHSSFFPFGAEYINTSLFSEGTYNERSHIFKTGQYGQMGWEYPNGADMSGYKYLVVNMKRTASTAHLNIFTSNSIWGDCCATPDFGSKRQIVVDLQNAVYTSGDKTGQPLNTKNVRIVSFWGNNLTIVVEDMYLTNNDDYTRGIPDGIDEIENEERRMKNEEFNTGIYDLSGRKVGAEANSSFFTLHSSLKKGIYIVNGKKVIF